mgnify:CR=1 FL=1
MRVIRLAGFCLLALLALRLGMAPTLAQPERDITDFVPTDWMYLPFVSKAKPPPPWIDSLGMPPSGTGGARTAPTRTRSPRTAARSTARPGTAPRWMVRPRMVRQWTLSR